MRFHEVYIRPEARTDLFDIYEYLALQTGKDFAFRYVDRIQSACQGLLDFPNRGVKRDDLGAGLRSLNFEGRAVILYHLVGETVEIVRILHAGRNVTPDLFEH